jgi:hypothetical protein
MTDEAAGAGAAAAEVDEEFEGLLDLLAWFETTDALGRVFSASSS